MIWAYFDRLLVTTGAAHMAGKELASLKIAVMLDKKERRVAEMCDLSRFPPPFPWHLTRVFQTDLLLNETV